ncbi:MAG TPA: hypothetical protein O0Y06_03880 [Methanocorpusculum sp.]|nr:hypothetical protein [Methanocorpusculum sp.]
MAPALPFIGAPPMNNADPVGVAASLPLAVSVALTRPLRRITGLTGCTGKGITPHRIRQG